ncbi:hypothetical protein HDU81_000435 [Chytriomyces hyalinus]|nr:hypothetical protein HDU81_000435 [Chytriomyces hyalinus]
MTRPSIRLFQDNEINFLMSNQQPIDMTQLAALIGQAVAQATAPLQQEIQQLRQASARPTNITNTIDIVEAAVSDLTAVDLLNPGGGALTVDNWKRALDHLRCGYSIKEAFSSTSALSAEDLREAKLAKTIVAAIGGSSRARPGLACSTQGRDGHQAKDCFAGTNIEGVKLE